MYLATRDGKKQLDDDGASLCIDLLRCRVYYLCGSMREDNNEYEIFGSTMSSMEWKEHAIDFEFTQRSKRKWVAKNGVVYKELFAVNYTYVIGAYFVDCSPNDYASVSVHHFQGYMQSDATRKLSLKILPCKKPNHIRLCGDYLPATQDDSPITHKKKKESYTLGMIYRARGAFVIYRLYNDVEDELIATGQVPKYTAIINKNRHVYDC